MQLTRTKEHPMRTASLFAADRAAAKPLSPAPGHVIPAPGRLELNPEELIRSLEISDDEILDDLLYPADHRAARSGGWESGGWESGRLEAR
jgi:hypothetical protein